MKPSSNFGILNINIIVIVVIYCCMERENYVVLEF